MLSAAQLQSELVKRLSNLTDLGGGVLRGERVHQGKVFAKAYIDISDQVVARSNDLPRFQERLVGDDFFKGGDERWNSYVYFLAGPTSSGDAAYTRAKAVIENDRHFARKFVVSETELLRRLSIDDHHVDAAAEEDVGSRWSELLQRESLAQILQQAPRTKTIEQIATGAAFVATGPRIESKVTPPKPNPLQSGYLRTLDVGAFRSAISKKRFTFADVNLIFGLNGAGKTSILEAIEAFYCGRTRRDQNALIGEIRGEVEWPVGTRVAISVETNSAQIKARNLAWYGRPDQLASTIVQAFTRFNFLDTDAAFRLSSESDPELIKQDLSRLLVGAETSALWAYLIKLLEDVEAGIKSAGNLIPSLTKQVELLSDEIFRLKNAPSSANSLKKSYQAGLDAIGATWSTAGADISLDEEERRRLEALSRGFRQTTSASSSGSTNLIALRAQVSDLVSAKNVLQGLAETHRANTEARLAVERERKEADSNTQILARWQEICLAGYPAAVARLSERREEAKKLREMLGSFSIHHAEAVLAEFGELALQAAQEAASQTLRTASERARLASEALRQREQAGESLSTLKVELRQLALAVIERSSDGTHCPVCQTTHGESDLLEKIDALLTNGNLDGVDSLHFAVQVARESVERATEQSQLLATLADTVASPRAPGDETVSVALDMVRAKEIELQSLSAEAAQLESDVSAIEGEGGGLEIRRIRRLAVEILADADPESERAVSDRLLTEEQRLNALDARQQALANATQNLEEEANKVALNIGSFGVRLAPLPELVVAAEKQCSIATSALTFVEGARSLVRIDDDQDLNTIGLQIDELIKSFDEALHAHQAEFAANAAMEQKSHELQSANEQLTTSQVRQKNLQRARDVLQELKSKHSLDGATSSALEAIREDVSAIFGRIHAPNEYVLGDFDSGALLRTMVGNESRGPNQVSTGQRAALALSIFLAMNKSASRAPPLMLIDDPVAHVDDLNALSFLDYLRDIAVTGSRQIFFATADARLAALFEKKFAFLGDRFRKTLLSSVAGPGN